VTGVGWGAGLLRDQAAVPARCLQLLVTVFTQVLGRVSFTKQFFSKRKFENEKVTSSSRQ
jgi:hypothetical protein